MFFEVACSCSASLALDTSKDKEDASWLLINRFINAHTACGLMTPLPDSTQTRTKRYNIETSSEQD